MERNHETDNNQEEQVVHKMTEIMKHYAKGPEKTRKIIVQGLEDVISRIENHKTKVNWIYHENIIDSEKARKIRISNELTQRDLAKKIGISQSDVSRYETDGIRYIKRNSIIYLNWLKENGYDYSAEDDHR